MARLEGARPSPQHLPAPSSPWAVLELELQGSAARAGGEGTAGPDPAQGGCLGVGARGTATGHEVRTWVRVSRGGQVTLEV